MIGLAVDGQPGRAEVIAIGSVLGGAATQHQGSCQGCEIPDCREHDHLE